MGRRGGRERARWSGAGGWSLSSARALALALLVVPRALRRGQGRHPGRTASRSTPSEGGSGGATGRKSGRRCARRGRRRAMGGGPRESCRGAAPGGTSGRRGGRVDGGRSAKSGTGRTRLAGRSGRAGRLNGVTTGRALRPGGGTATATTSARASSAASAATARPSVALGGGTTVPGSETSGLGDVMCRRAPTDSTDGPTELVVCGCSPSTCCTPPLHPSQRPSHPSPALGRVADHGTDVASGAPPSRSALLSPNVRCRVPAPSESSCMLIGCLRATGPPRHGRLAAACASASTRTPPRLLSPFARSAGAF